MRSLEFKLLGIPIAVDPWFWAIAVLLGAQLTPALIPIWILSVFVGVLVHELGHALAGRYYGLAPAIRLYALGGVTTWPVRKRLPTWNNVALSLAGPMAGFALGIVLWLLLQLMPLEVVRTRWVNAALSFGLFVNFGWGALNLLPVLPLDGGNVMRELVYRYVLRPAPELPPRISMIAAGVMALLGLASGSLVLAGLFGWLAYANYQDYERVRIQGMRWR